MTKKEKIIHTALNLFAKHGYTETSISKIAKAAGVSKGLTYTHFENKEDLLKAVVVETLGRMTNELIELKEVNMTLLLKEYFRALKSQKELIRLCMLLVVHPETPQMVKDLLGMQQQELLTTLRFLLKDRISAEHLDIEARLLLATLDGITLEYITTGDTDLLERIEVQLLTKYKPHK